MPVSADSPLAEYERFPTTQPRWPGGASASGHGHNPEMIEAYLEKYPTGEFQDLACIRLKELRNKRRADE